MHDAHEGPRMIGAGCSSASLRNKREQNARVKKSGIVHAVCDVEWTAHYDDGSRTDGSTLSYLCMDIGCHVARVDLTPDPITCPRCIRKIDQQSRW